MDMLDIAIENINKGLNDEEMVSEVLP